MHEKLRSAMLARLKASGGFDRVLALRLALEMPEATASQIADVTGVSLAHLQASQLGLDRGLASDYSQGWCAVRTGSFGRHRETIFAKYCGNVAFWHGAARGIFCVSLAAPVRAV